MIFIIFVLSNDDEELLISLFNSLNAKMYTVAYKVLENPEDVEEALQEAFMRMMNNIERIKNFPFPERAPYCVTIVKNVSKNIRRSRKLHLDTDEIGNLITDTYSNPEKEFFAKVDSANIWKKC